MNRHAPGREVPPQAARAVSRGILVECRACPVCQKPLAGKQRLCSGRCRARWSRENRGRARADVDRQIRWHVTAVLELLEKPEQ